MQPVTTAYHCGSMNAPLLLKSTHPILSLRGSSSVTANDFKKGRLTLARILGLCVVNYFACFKVFINIVK